MSAPSRSQATSEALAPGLRSNELELLLSSSGVELTSARAARIRELASLPLDWDALIVAASEHRVLPLLFTHLDALAGDLVPPAALERLRAEFVRNAQQSLLLTSELHDVARLFAAHDIPMIPYKGPVLAQQLYGNVALRQMSDLDVLVPRSQVERARMLLCERGYRAVDLAVPGVEGIILRSECNIGFVRPDRRLTLELHWAFTAGRFSFALGFEELSQRLDTIRVGGAELPAIRPDDLLLILCFHGARHRWERLEWIVGVAELLRRHPHLDWNAVIARAERLGCKRMLLLGVALTHTLFGEAVSATMGSAMAADGELVSLVERIRAGLFTGSGRLAHTTGMPFHRFQVQVKERLRDKLRYVSYAVAAPEKEDWLALPLPDAWYPLYFLVRPFRLAGRFGARLAGS